MSHNTWVLTDHVCRHCFGRVLSRGLPDARTLFQCANCGTQMTGLNVGDLCCCGLTNNKGADARFRCVRNRAQTPEYPSELMVCFLGPDPARS